MSAQVGDLVRITGTYLHGHIGVLHEVDAAGMHCVHVVLPSVDEYAWMTGEEFEALPPLRWMYCPCCGALSCGRQWPEQDAGYGICSDCWSWLALPVEELRRRYGLPGVHHSLPVQEVNS